MSYFTSLHCSLGFFLVMKRPLGVLAFLKHGKACSSLLKSMPVVPFVPQHAYCYL